jgi:hypothetical protein
MLPDRYLSIPSPFAAQIQDAQIQDGQIQDGQIQG